MSKHHRKSLFGFVYATTHEGAQLVYAKTAIKAWARLAKKLQLPVSFLQSTYCLINYREKQH